MTLANSSTDAEIRIKVSDTGIGIPADALPRVFDRFFRVDPLRSKTSGGTGLGLAIVQSIMTLHGGSSEVASQLGRGTCVTLRMLAPAYDKTATSVYQATSEGISKLTSSARKPRVRIAP